jgi:recombination protein RecT
MDTIQALFSDRRTIARIAAVIPRHLTPERLLKVLVSSIAKTPKLLECSMMSILQAAIAMGELGLEPDAVRGLAYLVPYTDRKRGTTTCQLIIGYRGFIELARRSGTLRQVEARVVYERDKLDVRFGLEPRFEHLPFLDGDAGRPKLVYGIARFSDGGEHIEVMTMAQVEEVRKRSRAATTGPWATDYEEMAKKTVMRRLAKWLPLSPELAKAIEVSDQEQLEVGERMLAPVRAAPALPADAGLGAGSLDALELAPAEPEETSGPPPHDPVTGEVLEEGAEAPVQSDAPPHELTDEEKAIAAEVEALKAFIAGAATKTELRKLAAKVQGLPEPERSEVQAAYEARAKELA